MFLINPVGRRESRPKSQLWVRRPETAEPSGKLKQKYRPENSSLQQKNSLDLANSVILTEKCLITLMILKNTGRPRF